MPVVSSAARAANHWQIAILDRPDWAAWSAVNIGEGNPDTARRGSLGVELVG
jgi:hypothetical protein